MASAEMRALFLAYIFLISLSLGIYDVIFNLYILRLGFREDFLGLMLSLVSISTGLFAIPAAMFCDRAGRKNTLLLSCLLLSVILLQSFTPPPQHSCWLFSAFSMVYPHRSRLLQRPHSWLKIPRVMKGCTCFRCTTLLYTIGVMMGNLAGGTLPQVFINSLNIEPTGSGAYQLSLYASLFAVLISLLPLLLIKDQKTKLIRTPKLWFRCKKSQNKHVNP